MKRHRNHVLEDLSVTALRATLPEMWIVHDFRRDYGVDVQIEIFDEVGNTTGLRVYGQLKATDNSETEDVLSLDRDHFEYWSAHSDPVLLLRYFAEIKAFQWCWMHDIEWRMKPGASSIDVAPYLKSWHQEETPKAIEQLSRLRREILHQRLPLPTTISIRNASDGITGSLKLATLLESRLPTKYFKTLGESASPCHFDILLESKKLRINYAGLPGFVVARDSDSDLENIADLSVLLIFLISCRYDKSSGARAIGLQASATLFRAASEEFRLFLFDGLVYALGIDQAIPLIFREAPNKEDPGIWVTVHAVGHRASERYGQTELWHKQLSDWADSPPYPEMAASAAYNAANAFANSGLWQEALTYYRLAGEREAGYFNKDYYWTELGAAQFEMGHASAAATSYQKAYDINPTAYVQWRLGDALFHCGRYEAALLNISSAFSSDENIGSYPELVLAVCEELISTWGIKEQEIRPVADTTQEKLMALSEATSAENLIFILRPFLEVCAIDPLLSFNAGHLAIISNQPRLGMYRFLTCALRQRGDVQAWACAIASAWKVGEVGAFGLLIETAYFYVGEDLIDAVLKSFVGPRSLPVDSVIELQQQLIALIRATEKSSDKSFTMRLHQGGGIMNIDGMV